MQGIEDKTIIVTGAAGIPGPLSRTATYDRRS
jgi:hypothetical protein